MIYLVYPLVIIVFLLGSHLYGKGKWNDDAFSLGQMKALQGFIAFIIMFHHCGQRTCASWMDKRYYVAGLEFFVPIGYVLVAFFTFCSGYGLYKSLKNKKDYLSGKFIVHRILPIIITGYVVSMIFLLARYLLGHNISSRQLIYYVSGVQLCNPNGWYVIVIPFFYLCFFLAFKFIQNEMTALLAVLLFTVAYQLFGASLDHNDWWVRGEWWYNSIHLFAVGIFFAMNEERIVAHLKKYYTIYFIAGLILIPVLFGLSEFTKAVFSYYGEYSNASHRMLRRLVCLLAEILFSSDVVFWFFLLGMKMKLGNPFLKLMGTVTLEFYLIHGLYVEMFAHHFDEKYRSLYYIRNNAVFVTVVFALGLASALIMKYCGNLVRKLISGKKAEKSMDRA